MDLIPAETNAQKETNEASKLIPVLSPLMIWGLGVGYVISGMYFGWNLGLKEGGPYGFLVSIILVTIMYATLVLTYAELACALPHAGGAFVYANRALGPRLGLLAGIGQWVEFVFAPPAIAAAIGAYFQIFFPQMSATGIAFIAYILFTGLNICGVKHSAFFELFMTFFAVIELLIFAVIAGGKFTWAAFSMNPLPHGWSGSLAALPYAIWFYLAIEGMANIAEEAKNPQKDLSIGFVSAMGTLIVLTLLVFFTAVGVAGWQAVVFIPGTTTTSDSPLPLALALVIGKNHWLYHLVIAIGLFGLIASFHGIILASGRATLEFGRIGYAPKIVSHILPNRKTPAVALVVNMGVGFLALLTGSTGEIITLSVFGALTLYIVSTLAYFKLPTGIHRPFRTPGAPVTPIVALVLASLCFVTMFYYNTLIGGIYLILVGCGFVWYRLILTAESK